LPEQVDHLGYNKTLFGVKKSIKEIDSPFEAKKKELKKIEHFASQHPFQAPGIQNEDPDIALYKQFLSKFHCFSN
jgi:hypothetical protein